MDGLSVCGSRYLTIVKYLSSKFFCDVSIVPTLGHYEAIRADIIQRLVAERKRRKLSRYAVSQNSGVSESMLSLVERGMRNPTLELVLRIADGIGANLPEIIQKAWAEKRQSKGK